MIYGWTFYFLTCYSNLRKNVINRNRIIINYYQKSSQFQNDNIIYPVYNRLGRFFWGSLPDNQSYVAWARRSIRRQIQYRDDGSIVFHTALVQKRHNLRDICYYDKNHQNMGNNIGLSLLQHVRHTLTLGREILLDHPKKVVLFF